MGRTSLNTRFTRAKTYTQKAAEHLTAANIKRQSIDKNSTAMGEKGDRSKSVFKEDESILEPFRAKLADYFRSGYDRGHMCVVVLLNSIWKTEQLCVA